MRMATKAELEREREELLDRIEEARAALNDALGIVEDDETDDVDDA